MLYALAGLPRVCALRDLEKSSSAIWRAAGRPAGTRRLIKALRELDDSFIHSLRARGDTGIEHAVQVLNPSLIDFLQQRLLEDSEAALAVLEGAPYFDQVEWLASRLVEKEALDDELCHLLVVATERTLSAAPPTTWLGHSRGDHPLGTSADRLLAVAGWVSSKPELREPLHNAHDLLLRDAMRMGDRATSYGLQAWISLIRPLLAAGYPTTSLVAGIKQRISQLGSSLEVLEAARDLRAAAPTVYSPEEWEQMGGEFWAWQGFALDEPNAYFDDLDELDRVSSLADAFGHSLDEIKFDEAYEQVEEARAEAAERAMEEVDPDDYRDEERVVVGGPDDSEYIDAIFDGLRD
jgi:hypothetical protein